MIDDDLLLNFHSTPLWKFYIQILVNFNLFYFLDAVITEAAFNETSETIDDDMGLVTTLEASQSPTTITDELTPSVSDTIIMQTSEAMSNSRREITFAYTSPITTNRPCK